MQPALLQERWIVVWVLSLTTKKRFFYNTRPHAFYYSCWMLSGIQEEIKMRLGWQNLSKLFQANTVSDAVDLVLIGNHLYIQFINGAAERVCVKIDLVRQSFCPRWLIDGQEELWRKWGLKGWNEKCRNTQYISESSKSMMIGHRSRSLSSEVGYRAARTPLVGILFYLGQWQTLKAEEEDRRDKWMDRVKEEWRAGGQELCVRSNGGTGNVHLEKKHCMNRINEDMVLGTCNKRTDSATS